MDYDIGFRVKCTNGLLDPFGQRMGLVEREMAIDEDMQVDKDLRA